MSVTAFKISAGGAIRVFAATAVLVASGLLPAVALRAQPTDDEAGLRLFVAQSAWRDFATPPGELRGGIRGFELALQALRGDSWALSAGLDYAYTRFEYRGLDSRNRDLHRVSLPVTLRLAGARAEHRLRLSPGLATSSNVLRDLLRKGTTDDYRLHGLWTWTTLPGGGWAWELGIARDHSLGRSAWWPRIGPRWKNENWEIGLVLPEPAIRYTPAPSWSVGLAVRPAGEQWRVRSAELQGRRFDYRLRQWQAGVTVRRQVLQRLALEGETGVLFHRRHRLVDDQGSAQRLDPASAAYLGLAVRVPF